MQSLRAQQVSQLSVLLDQNETLCKPDNDANYISLLCSTRTVSSEVWGAKNGIRGISKGLF